MNLDKTIKLFLLVTFTFLITSCINNADERYDTGYSDGYAEGYNTTCEIRATLIEGDWSDEDYSRGYSDGRVDGTTECLVSRKNN